MEERKFQVLEQTTPSRCEVCHQADQFDVFTATCMRCQALLLAQSLPEEHAARYQQFQQNARPFDKSVPVSDLFRILPEAFNLYSRNFWLFLKVCLLGQVPITVVSILPSFLLAFASSVFSPLAFSSLIIALSFVSLGFTFLLWPIMSGALTKAILDRYRGEEASLSKSYGFIFEKGWKYLVTSVLGELFQSVGFFLCLIGGVFTFPRGMFVQEVSIIEDKYYGESLKRSITLATKNIAVPLLFGIIWIGGNLVVQLAIVSSLALVLGLFLSATAANFIGQITAAFFGLLMVPFFFTSKLLLYFHLRMRTDEVLFIGDTPKKSMYPMPEQ